MLWPPGSYCFGRNPEGPYGYCKQIRVSMVSEAFQGLGKAAMCFWAKTSWEEGYTENDGAHEVWKTLAARKIDLLPTEEERNKFRESIRSDFQTPWKPLCSGTKDEMLRRLTVYFDLEVDNPPAHWHWSG